MEESKAERFARLRGLRRGRPLTFARLVSTGRITAEDLAEMDRPAERDDTMPHDG